MVKYPDFDAGERLSKEADFLSNRADYTKFLDRLYKEEGIDLSLYKQNQMRRRINLSVNQANCNGYCEFLDKAKLDIAVYRRFVDRITINVSEFIRNADKFKILEEKFLLPILKRKPIAKIWSAGCSTGEEPYSLALLLEKHFANAGTTVLGWDFDKNALERAKLGIYGRDSVKNVQPELVKKFFSEVDDEKLQVSDVLKKRCRLERHNLLEDRFPTRMDIILCRNVVIYFNERAKKELFMKFAAALDKEGVLMIGASERIPNDAEIGLRNPLPFFYVHKDSSYPARF